jgi:hypothetical protein
MTKVNDFVYEFVLPPELSSSGLLNYFVSITKEKDILTFPGKLNKTPEYWTFDTDDSYVLSILPSSDKILIYKPQRDIENLIAPNIWRFVDYRIDYNFDEDNELELNIDIRRIREKFPELALQFYVGEYLENFRPDVDDKLELEIKKSIDGPDSILVRMIFNNSTGIERKVALKPEYERIILPITKPGKLKYALLPRPYPTFLPYWFESIPQSNISENPKLESIQISIPLNESGIELNNYSIKLKNVYLINSKK